MSLNSKYTHLACLLIGVAFGALLFGAHFSHRPRKSEVENAFVLGVSVKFRSTTDKDNFKDIIGPVADYIAKFELNTISYEVMDSDKEPTQIYILERYKTKRDYLEVHRKTEIFLSFREKFQAMITAGLATVDGHSYIESGIGFV